MKELIDWEDLRWYLKLPVIAGWVYIAAFTILVLAEIIKAI